MPVLTHVIPTVIGRWRDMPLSALLCLVDLCFLTMNPHHNIHHRNMTMLTTKARPSIGTATVSTRFGGDGMDTRFENGTIDTRFGTGGMGTNITNSTVATRFGSDTVGMKKVSSMTERLDALDIDAILKNTRLFNIYLKCMLDTAPCTAEGKEMKREVVELLHTGCENCTENTKTRLRKSFVRMKSDPKLRESYKLVLEKYDPNKIYIQNLEKFLQ